MQLIFRTEYEKSIVQRFQNKIKIKLLRKKLIDRHKQSTLDKVILKIEQDNLSKEVSVEMYFFLQYLVVFNLWFTIVTYMRSVTLSNLI